MIRVFPRKTNLTPDDALAFVGDPPFLDHRPPEQPVKISVTFTWDREEGRRLQRAWGQYYSDVELGGPAFNSPCDSFTPGMFLKEGVTFTSRGCCWDCPWCLARKREGKFIILPQIHSGHIIQDNNVLASPKERLMDVFDMLSSQKKAAIFSGGLDTRLVSPWHRALFDSIRIKELWFACDTMDDLERLEQTADIFRGYSMNKLRCYTMIGFNETIDEARTRLEAVFNLGFLPYAQLYQGEVEKAWPKEWNQLGRTFKRPAATKAYMKEANKNTSDHEARIQDQGGLW